MAISSAFKLCRLLTYKQDGMNTSGAYVLTAGTVFFLLLGSIFSASTPQSAHQAARSAKGYKIGGRIPLSRSKRSILAERETDGAVPDEMDWRTTGCVTKVKDQWPCGSCWAFSAAGSLEGQYCIKTGLPAVSLSPQHLMDCVSHHKLGGKSFGCLQGGSEDHAFRYIIKSGGIATETKYPYEAQTTDFDCRHDKNAHIELSVKGYVRVAKGNETALKQSVGFFGPVSVGIHVRQKFESFTGTGVFEDEDCNGPVNHAVLVVGYGTQNGTDYWLVKNSYGTQWGDKGYVKMARNKRNQCQIASEAVYPVL